MTDDSLEALEEVSDFFMLSDHGRAATEFTATNPEFGKAFMAALLSFCMEGGKTGVRPASQADVESELCLVLPRGFYMLGTHHKQVSDDLRNGRPVVAVVGGVIEQLRQMPLHYDLATNSKLARTRFAPRRATTLGLAGRKLAGSAD
jgi:hypothetical protein